MSFYKEVPGLEKTLESTLKFDTEPKAGSTNPVTSGGVKDAIDGAVGDVAENLQQQIDGIAERAGSGYTPKGEATVATLNGLSGQENGWLYTMTDAGTLTDGSLAVVAGDTVAWDATNSVWYKAMDYAPAQYGTNEVHNLPTTITAFRTGDVIAVDGPSGTAKMSKDDLLKETSGDVFGIMGNDIILDGDLIASSSDAYDWQNGLCDKADGSISANANYKYNATLIPVYPNTKYTIGGRANSERVYCYNSSGYYIGNIKNWSTNVSSAEITTPADCYFVRYSYYAGYTNYSKLVWHDGFSTKGIKNIEGDVAVCVKKSSDVFENGTAIASSGDNYDWQNGLCDKTDGSITASTAYKYNNTLIPVYPNLEYKIGGRGNVERIYCYDAEQNFIGAVKNWSSNVSSATFTTLPKTKFVRYSYYAGYPTYSILSWNKGLSSTRLEDIAETLPSTHSPITKTCPTIYDRVMSSTSLGCKNETRVYPENFTNYANEKVKIDGGAFASVSGKPLTGGKIALNLSVLGYAEKNVQVPVTRVTMSDARATKEFILCVGESTTDASAKDPLYNAIHEEWGYPSAIQSYAIKDNSDGVGKTIKTIGTRGNQNATITYKGNTYTNRSFHEGRSGWPSYAYGRWPCLAKLSPSTTRFGAVQMWYALGLASKTPYYQASYNNDREEYAGTAVQRDLITKTKFGYYKIDGDENLWKLCQYLSGRDSFPVFADTASDYDGSASQVQMIQDWCDALASDPINPFYDVTIARDAIHDTAFSVDTYLSRFRTMDDVGVRLSGSAGQSVIGSDGETYTIGTKVSDINAYDVCTPTTIIFNIGINDVELTPGPGTIIDAVKALVNSTSIKCGWFVTKHAGAHYPSLWTNCNAQEYKVISTHLEIAQDSVNTWLGTQVDKTALPSAFVQPPNSVIDEFESVSNDVTNRFINSSNDNLHPGINAYRAIGWMLVNWIYSL